MGVESGTDINSFDFQAKDSIVDETTRKLSCVGHDDDFPCGNLYST